jgi:hypothetical protein
MRKKVLYRKHWKKIVGLLSLDSISGVYSIFDFTPPPRVGGDMIEKAFGEKI